MADLGYRENVLGPQPIGKVVEPPPAMLEAFDTMIHALMRGDREEVEGMTEAKAIDDIKQVESAIAPGAYDRYEVTGRARISRHFYTKVRLTGASPMTLQFRLGHNGDRWTIREVINLTGRRSGWSK
jgi:hypothetical protein